ncbi:hypothetical protein BV22DRAFT_422532 [Leucogyrophana mollusca]|uniref:Uncharacterized protein n=1 Tax=Leucogyrophana mollusca TaxID=85980 RepID=A0ACB8BIJ9_9AGAM|nr:hypothetical protein BV22DRAFT_422532 [Leucogyrophana mollusca]
MYPTIGGRIEQGEKEASETLVRHCRGEDSNSFTHFNCRVQSQRLWIGEAYSREPWIVATSITGLPSYEGNHPDTSYSATRPRTRNPGKQMSTTPTPSRRLASLFAVMVTAWQTDHCITRMSTYVQPFRILGHDRNGTTEVPARELAIEWCILLRTQTLRRWFVLCYLLAANPLQRRSPTMITRHIMQRAYHKPLRPIDKRTSPTNTCPFMPVCACIAANCNN